MQDPQALIFTNDASSADGTAFLDVNASLYVSGQIFYDVFQARYGHGGGGVVVMGIPAIAMMLCTCSSVTSNSRCNPSATSDAHGHLAINRSMIIAGTQRGTICILSADLTEKKPVGIGRWCWLKFERCSGRPCQSWVMTLCIEHALKHSM